MRATILSFIVVLALLISPVLADFAVDVTTVKESILPGDSAVFEITVENRLTTSDRYTISSLEYDYILFIEERPGDLDSGESGEFLIEIQPRSFVNPGRHVVPLQIRSANTGENEDFSLSISLRDPERESGVYTPSIALGVGVPEIVDPRDDLTMNIHMRNRNARSYDRNDPITVRIQSDLFYREYTTQLGGVSDEGEKSNEITLDLNPYQAPGEHQVTVSLLVQNSTVSVTTERFEIGGYDDLVQTPAEDGGFFTSTTTYRLTNEGNTPQIAEIRYPINSFQRPFLSASENYVIVSEESGTYALIQKDLQPEEEALITVTENYRLLALLVLIAILSIIGYYLLRSPLVLGKEAEVVSSDDDGVSQIKARILVKNRSAKTMHNLRVIDRISGVAEIIEEKSLGTLPPTKVVKKKGQGTLIRWDVEQLEPFEERIISYKARMPLKIVGDVTLPSAKVKYDLPTGRERTTHSNEVSIVRL